MKNPAVNAGSKPNIACLDNGVFKFDVRNGPIVPKS